MRKIDRLIVHCAATRCNMDFPVQALIRCHSDRFGFTGYHYYITRNGKVYQTRNENLVGAHVAGYNKHSIGICYEGGLDAEGHPADTRTEQQRESLVKLLRQLRQRYPDAEIMGHRDLPGVKKDCPCFDARAEYQGI